MEEPATDGRRDARRALEALLGKLVAAGPPSPYTFNIQVVDSKTVNAFAAPGGYIVVLRGLIDEARSPEELAAIAGLDLEDATSDHPVRVPLGRTPASGRWGWRDEPAPAPARPSAALVRAASITSATATASRGSTGMAACRSAGSASASAERTPR